MTPTPTYIWHLRTVMADRGMFATTELGPLLASRGVALSREQVYRLVTGTPARLNLTTLAALCDIFDVTPAALVEVTAGTTRPIRTTPAATPSRGIPSSQLRPRRARIVPDVEG